MSTYSKILLATDEANTHEEKTVVYDAVFDWSDSDTEISMVHTVTPVAESGLELSLPSISHVQNEIINQAQKEIVNLANDSGIEGHAKILARKFKDAIKAEPADESTLAIVSNDQNNADLYELKCDTLFVRA